MSHECKSIYILPVINIRHLDIIRKTCRFYIVLVLCLSILMPNILRFNDSLMAYGQKATSARVMESNNTDILHPSKIINITNVTSPAFF